MKSQSAWLPPLIFGTGLIALWEGATAVFDLDRFVLPKPSAIGTSLIDQWPLLRHAGWETGKIAISGLIVGIIVGAVAALFITRFRLADQALTPLAVALNATPIMALAPIFNAWFGTTDDRSNQAVVIVVVFFPVFINTTRGLADVPAHQIELMKSLAASEWTIMGKVRIPNALPYFLTSLRLTAPLCVIAAIVAEYFGGPQDRIGPTISQSASFSRYDDAWAAIVVASAIGLALFVLASAAERIVTPWRQSDSALS